MKKEVILVVLLFIGLASAGILNAVSEASQAAINYILTKPQNAWTTMAKAAASQSNISSDHLLNISGNNANDYSSAILAITAINQGPRVFGPSDYVAKLESFWDGTQLGDQGLLNDDIFGLLALISAGEPALNPIVAGIKSYIMSEQNSDGGWGWSPAAGSDSNMTSASIMALISAGVSNADPVIQKATDFLKTMQNQDGGFKYDASDFSKVSDAASDSWAISAIYAIGQNPSQWTKGTGDPLTHLKSLQDSAGGFFHHQQQGDQETSFTPTETAYAVIALEGKFFPLNIVAPTQNFSFRIEGRDETICKGSTSGPTAMDIVKNAASICGFTYNIETTSFGPYLTAIANDTASGSSGWLYLVNSISPAVGAADYNLQAGDEVLWYFGEFSLKPTKLEMDNNGTTVSLHAAFFDNSTWQDLSMATVKAGSSDFITDSSGKVSFSIASLQDGLYQMFAVKNGYIRSNKIALNVGQAPASHGVGLRVNVLQIQPLPQNNQDSIVFSVSPSVVDFGDMKAGDTKSRTINLSNDGSQNIYVETEVEGAEVFKSNLTVNGNLWNNFSANIVKNSSSDIQLGLAIPNNYSGSFGEREGGLTFWAVTQ